MATFITSKSVGQDINFYVETSTGYWKYNHNGSDSSVFSNAYQTITVTNANGEFTIISCLEDGTPSGDIIQLDLQQDQLTSFDGTGLTGLTSLGLQNNQITSFDGTDLISLTGLYLEGNQLTSFDGTGLTSLTSLGLGNNQITSSSNNQILNLLDQYGLENGEFYTTGGRTSAGTADYDALIAKGWNLLGLDLTGGGGGGVNVTGKLRIKGATTIGTPPSPLFTNITLGGIISFGSPNNSKSKYYRQLIFDYDQSVLSANMGEGSTYEIVMITTSNYFSENTIAGISSMDIGGTTYYRGNAHKVGVQGVGAKGSVTILTAQWSNSNPNTLIVDTPNNLVGNYTPFTLTTWRFALIKDGNYVNGTLSSQSFLGSELDAF